MASLLLRVATLVALLLMPVGMATAPAAAQHAVSGAADHCDEHQQPAAPSAPKAHCAGCVALPAIDLPAAAGGPVPQGPVLIALATPVCGSEPEIATPPPKLS